MKVEQSIVIDRPPHDVFAYLAVRSNDAVWMASVLDSAWLDADAADTAPIDVGRRGRLIMRLPGRRAVFIDEVTEYVPGRRIAHRTIEGPIPLRTACQCDPAGQGRCRATVSGEVDRLPGGVFGRMAAPAFTALIRRGFRADLVGLKRLLEDNASQAAGGAATPADLGMVDQSR